MHAHTQSTRYACIHSQLFKKLRTIFFCFVGFFFLLSQSTTNFPKGHEMHSQPGPGFYKDHTSQAKPDHSEQVEGCVCVWEGVKQYFQTFCLVLLMDQSEITTCQTISQSQTQKALRGRGGGRCLNRSMLTFLCRDTFLTSRD